MKKRKKLVSYQPGGQSCGEGMQWNDELQTCVPIYNYDVVPLKSATDHTFDSTAGFKDIKGNFVPYKNANTDAIQKGFTYNSDGGYRKPVVTENRNNLQYSEFFQGLNPLLDATRFVGNAVQNVNAEQEDQNTLRKARYKNSRYSINETGFNNVPVYLEFGGKSKKQAGGKTPIHTSNPNDPRLKAYKDSLRVYNYVKGFNSIQDQFPKSITSNDDEKKAFEISKVLDKFQSTPEAEKAIKLTFDKNYHVPIIRSTTSGSTMDILQEKGVFPKPVQPVVYQKPKMIGIGKDPKTGQPIKMYDSALPNGNDWEPYNPPTPQRPKGALTNPYLQTPYLSGDGNMPTPNSSAIPIQGYKYDPTQKTKYSLTNHQGQTTYYPNKSMLKDDIFQKAAKNVSSQEGDDYMTATGYYQSGGEIPNPGYGMLNDGTIQDALKYAKNLKIHKNGNFKGLIPADSWNDDVLNYVDKFKNVKRNGERFIKVRGKLPNINTVQYTPEPLPPTAYTLQNGGDFVNNTGYLKGEKTANNPINIIPSNLITTENMAFPIMANGVLLHPNTGKYKFNSSYVVEKPAMRKGGKMKKYQAGGEDEVPQVDSANPQAANAMLEQGEVFQQNDGSIQKVGEDQPTHDQAGGGSPQPNVDRVLEDTGDKRNDKVSKLLRIKPKEAKALTGINIKSSITHSKLYEKVVEKDAKDIKGIEKKIEKNLEYAKNNGGIYAQNALEENMKLLLTAPTKQERFDDLYAHQEAKKQAAGISDEQNGKTGGSMNFKSGEAYKKWLAYGHIHGDFANTPGNQKVAIKGKSHKVKHNMKYGGDPAYKYQVGGDTPVDNRIISGIQGRRRDRYTGVLPPYPSTFTNYYDTQQNKQYTAPDWITPEQFYGTPGLKEYMSTLNDLNGVDNDMQKADDTQWGYRHQAALQKFFPNGKPATQVTPTAPTTSAVQAPTSNSKYTLPAETKPSTVNVGLGWSGGYGNLMGYIDSFGRIPVGLEQLDAQPVRFHEEDVRPTINANNADFNAASAQLPQNGVGFANSANLQGQKYRYNNQAVAAVETRNKAKEDQAEVINAQAQAQIDQANVGLRDQFTNRVLLGKEKQRQQKAEYLNGLFKAIDERNAFNRNANLALSLTPFFNENGQFNGNKYNISANYTDQGGNRVEYIDDKQSGQQFRVIYDKSGKLISSSKVVQDNKGAKNYNIPLK